MTHVDSVPCTEIYMYHCTLCEGYKPLENEKRGNGKGGLFRNVFWFEAGFEDPELSSQWADGQTFLTLQIKLGLA